MDLRCFWQHSSMLHFSGNMQLITGGKLDKSCSIKKTQKACTSKADTKVEDVDAPLCPIQDPFSNSKLMLPFFPTDLTHYHPTDIMEKARAGDTDLLLSPSNCYRACLVSSVSPDGSLKGTWCSRRFSLQTHGSFTWKQNLSHITISTTMMLKFSLFCQLFATCLTPTTNLPH